MPVRNPARPGRAAELTGTGQGLVTNSGDGRAAGAGIPETPESPHTAAEGQRQRCDDARSAPSFAAARCDKPQRVDGQKVANATHRRKPVFRRRTFVLSGSARETCQCGCRHLSQSLNSGVAPVAAGRAGEPWPHLAAVDTSQLGRRSRTAATALASWASKASSCSASAPLAAKARRSQAMPPRHIRSMPRVAVMSASGSPDTRTRSARCPAATRPRSARPNTRAGSAVAAARACAGLMPHRTRSSSSRCRLAPNTVPGFGASVPASRVTPASASRRTLSSARE
jgi:hypothetical protein